MFRIFAAFVRRIALGFYETGLLTLPHFFFLSLFFFFFYAFSTRFDCFPGEVYDRGKVRKFDRREYVSRKFFYLLENFRARRGFANDSWRFVLIVNNQQSTSFVNLLPMTLNK